MYLCKKPNYIPFQSKNYLKHMINGVSLQMNLIEPREPTGYGQGD